MSADFRQDFIGMIFDVLKYRRLGRGRDEGMGEKRKKIYEALVEGATHGHSDKELYEFVAKRCPKTSSKKIVRASLLALSDPALKDRNILNTIYALAIKHRLDDVRADDVDQDGDDSAERAPSISRERIKQSPATDPR
jgi:hypothetical protein